ncbi:HD domain-containing protein [Granulicella aggregans]|nr:HD domain-containing protein [Granulicella aggregans]
MDAASKIRKQFAFLAELDQLKSVIRQSPLINRTRYENSAEHSWHLAIFAIVLSEHADGVDPLAVATLLLVHDIVEIDAGDTPLHDPGRDIGVVNIKERDAARRIFGLLPEPQATHLLSLWEEFEANETPNAQFAKALDRLQPLLLNTLTDGGTWTRNNITQEQVMQRYGPVIEGASKSLWVEAAALIRRHFSKVEGAEEAKTDSVESNV